MTEKLIKGIERGLRRSRPLEHLYFYFIFVLILKIREVDSILYTPK